MVVDSGEEGQLVFAFDPTGEEELRARSQHVFVFADGGEGTIMSNSSGRYTEVYSLSLLSTVASSFGAN